MCSIINRKSDYFPSTLTSYCRPMEQPSPIDSAIDLVWYEYMNNVCRYAAGNDSGAAYIVCKYCYLTVVLFLITVLCTILGYGEIFVFVFVVPFVSGAKLLLCLTGFILDVPRMCQTGPWTYASALGLFLVVITSRLVCMVCYDKDDGKDVVVDEEDEVELDASMHHESESFNPDNAETESDFPVEAEIPTTVDHGQGAASGEAGPVELEEESQQQLHEKLNELKQRMRCVVCYVNTKRVLLLPCKHLCVCSRCASAITGQPFINKRCPICRGYVTHSYNAFV